MTRITFTVAVELQRIDGKFASKADLAATITEWLDAANEGQVDGANVDGDGSYEVTDWSVSDDA